jgi:hypothetical protein
MTIKNNSPFKLIAQPSQIAPPGWSLTVIVKGTFVLRHGAICTIAEDQLDFAPDEPFLDDIGRSLAWASDLVPYKPHSDFYIHGAFHQPDGKPAPTGTASFEFGPLKKTLVFHGPRLAVIRDGTWDVGPAKPVVSVPLRWEYSFGALSYPANPYGRGIEQTRDQHGDLVVELPLIEHPAHPIKTPADRPPPANFAPLPMLFLERHSKRGTYDQRWSMFRAPLPPVDYDPSFFNAAPGDQQGGNYPRGDETLTLRHLHPTQPVIVTKLPGLRPRVGVLRIRGDVPKDPSKIAAFDPWDVEADEVIMNLDTVVAVPEQDRLVLVWRGVQPMRQASVANEFAWLQCELDEPAHPPLQFPTLEAAMRSEFLKTKPPLKADAEKGVAELLAAAREHLAKVDIPQSLRAALETEKDPQKLFDQMIAYVNTELSALRRRAGLPPIPPSGQS